VKFSISRELRLAFSSSSLIQKKKKKKIEKETALEMMMTGKKSLKYIFSVFAKNNSK
jgi:hypothetical protein